MLKVMPEMKSRVPLESKPHVLEFRLRPRGRPRTEAKKWNVPFAHK